MACLGASAGGCSVDSCGTRLVLAVESCLAPRLLEDGLMPAGYVSAEPLGTWSELATQAALSVLDWVWNLSSSSGWLLGV